MKARAIDLLVCVECQGSLQCQILERCDSLPWLEIMEGRLMCADCGQNYPIREGIPRLVSGLLPHAVQKTVDGFGWEWLAFDHHIQDSYMSDETHFLDFIYPTEKSFFEGKLVLDAGCGMGRFLKLAAEFGSRDVIGVDLSRSVEAAYANTRLLPNAHVVQADIFALPFVRQFNYIFSVGVLHHLVDPQEGFIRLAKLLRENGRISAWVYGRENNGWVIHFLSPVRKHVSSHLPPAVLKAVSYAIALPLYAVLQLIYKPLNESRRASYARQRLPYNDYLYYSARLSLVSLVSVIFDHLVPQLAAYISREEFEGWFEAANLTNVVITARNNMSWRGQGTRLTQLQVDDC